MLHRHRHGGPGNASPVSTPTTKSSNCPNSHRGQHLCTHSGFPFSPSPFQFPPQEVTTWTLEEHPMEEHSHLTPGSAPVSSRPFLLQCQLTFNSYPQHYTSDSSKVFFTISYLKKSVLEWFKIGVMEIDPRLAPAWCSSWPKFISEICMHFGPLNPTRTAEIELHHLSMHSDSRISEYLVQFNTLASQVLWGDAAL